ncbi:chromatin structure-remodeling complex protein SYD isoform X1 [Medicago truncatula]|nr:chromatin structure-remodeling complex protein SYD isoform X1 [Medicago truncatula]
MASPQNVELEAAKFLHKLIQDSKDEPVKLATKLYVILQHMKSSGKEHSMPYQVISRAMETVINQHGLDIEALKSSRLPLTGVPQIGSSSQAVGGAKDSRPSLAESEAPKMEPFTSGRPPIAPTGGAPDYYQGSVAQRSNQSFDQESPSSLDSRSANSLSQDKRDTVIWDKQANQKDGKKGNTKRKRGDSTSPVEMHVDSSSLVEPRNTGVNTRKGKMTKTEPSDGIPAKSGEMTNFSVVPNNSQMENISTFSGNMKTMLRANPEGHHLLAKQTDSTNIGNPTGRAPNSKYPEDLEVSSAHIAPGKQQGAYARVHGGMVVPANVSAMNEPVFSSSMQYGVPLNRDGGSSNTLADGHQISQIGRQNSGSEMTMLRQGVPPRDTGKSPVPAASSTMPFKENQLKQLRAQCLVFLAFRNGLPPKKLHLEVAFGTFFAREDGSNKDSNDPKGKSQSFSEPGNMPGVIMPFGSSSNLRPTDKNPSGSSAGKFLEAESFMKGTDGTRLLEDKGNLHSDIQTPSEDSKHLAAKRDVERRIQERVAAQSSSATPYQQKDSSSSRGIVVGNSNLDDSDNGILTAGRANQPSVVGPNNWTGFAGPSEASKGPPQVSTSQHELPIERRENIPTHFQSVVNSRGSWNPNSVNHLTSYSLKEHWKPVPGIDSNHHGGVTTMNGNVLGKNVSAEQGGNDKLASADLPSKKFTMSERWIMDQQKKRLLVQQNWMQKQQKAKERMTTCFHKLKENVSSCEDISAKTKSVIELKKLQLLDLQRRLRSDFLNDFFKPVTSELEHLKSFKKNRHGRRVKQLERYELKMKEERQKRIRERQKEFFTEIEVHKEKLDDVFKIKRERWKGVNRYVKEFHKRKERIHREKIDRIQREKINLLKINDVEGYLRMVQDAKSDRVKQLLKATEKYLQKLGSKLQEAKAAAERSGQDVDEGGSTNFLENSETTLVDEDESDQAKHYMESNEKYYKMAHSVKESIAEQPSILHGGKLREYQMNGLRWLVSLYNNHLNGILADEMGLGKTVQVISLICYLMETKNDRGPFLVVVPSSVLPGWESEINFWAPSIHKIVYAGPPEERRRLFKERIVHHKFNVLLTTYEYLMNKHDRPKLSKVHWHYIIIDEGHRIKNASCKLNADLKHYQSSHRLLLTGTPLQNNLEELWALLNFLLPNIFNSSEDFSQWFNKPFESAGDNSPDEALLSEEENLLIINRLHQVLRPFVLRRLKHKVENQLPSKIERLIRCEASSYQKLLMKRVEDNLGAIGTSKARSVHNSVMELRNICNHPYLSQLHSEEVDHYIPKHYLPPIIRLCGKLEMLDRVLPKLKATDHRVLFFSTMTRLLDVMEEYLTSKQYRYLRLDGHTSGGDRGALIDLFNKPDSPYFIFLLSIRAGGVGVNLQAADTVILFDTDWNPQVDLQAQARAHRIGQKKDVLVLRFETVQTVEEQVRASAEHKLGVANQSITAGFFDNNTSAEDRREYLESLLRECKKEEAAPVLEDDALNDVLARSEAELDVFEAVDRNRKESELATWKNLVLGHSADGSDVIPPLPSRLVTDEDLKQFNEAMKIYDDVPKGEIDSNGVKRKRGALGGPDTQHYGRGKRAREVRSYEEQWTEEEFEKMCQTETPDSPKVKGSEVSHPTNTTGSVVSATVKKPAAVPPVAPMLPPVAPILPSVVPILPSVESLPVQHVKEITPPAKRGRGRPKRIASDKSPAAVIPPVTSRIAEVQLQKGNEPGHLTSSAPDTVGHSAEVTGVGGPMQQSTTGVTANIPPATPMPTNPLNSQSAATPMPTNTGPVQQSNTEVAANVLSATPMLSQSAAASVPIHAKGRGRKTQSGREWPRRRGKKQVVMSPPVPASSVGPDVKINEQLEDKIVSPSGQVIPQSETVPSATAVHHPTAVSVSASNCGNDNLGVDVVLNSQLPLLPLPSVTTLSPTVPSDPSVQMQSKGQIGKSQVGAGTPRRRGKKQATMSPPVPVVLGLQSMDPTSNLPTSSDAVSGDKRTELSNLLENNVQESKCIIQDQASQNNQALKTLDESDDLAKQAVISPSCEDSTVNSQGQDLEKVKNADVHDSSVKINSSETTPSKIAVCDNSENESLSVTTLATTEVTKDQHSDDKIHQTAVASKISPSVVDPQTNSLAGSATTESISQSVDPVTAKIVPSTLTTVYPSPPGSESNPSSYESVSAKRQGRKTQNRLEPPRRRGKKSAPALPVASDALIGQDPKLSHHAQISPVNSLVGIDTSNVTQAKALEVLLPSGVANDSKRKQRTTNPAQNKQQKVASPRIDSAPVSSDKVAPFGRIQNVNDVARVMKEVFSGTCLPKPKSHDPIGSEDRNTPFVHVTTKAAADASGSQSVEDKACSDIETAGVVCQTGNVAVNVDEKQSEGEGASDMQNLEGKPSLDAPTTGAPSLAPAMPVKGNKQESDIASDKNMILENMDLPNVSKPETICSGEVKAKAEQTQYYIENSTTKSEMEALDITPLNDEQKIDGSSERLRTSGCCTDISIETAPHEIGLSAASPVAEPPLVGDHNLGSQSDSLEKCSRSSPVAIDGTGCSTNPLGPEIYSNNPESSQADICVQSHLSANEAPDIIENTSNEKLEPSEPSSSFACADNTSLFGQAEILSDQPKVTPPSPAVDPQSRTIVISTISESAEINSRSETESSLKASAELSLGEGIVGDKISASGTEPPSLSLDPASPSEPSSKSPEPSMKRGSESASEKEGSVSPKAVQAQKHLDALEPSDLRETPLVESISESLVQERRDIDDSVSEVVVTDTVGVSGLGGETMSETAVLPPSTLVKEQNNGSVPLEKSMDKAVANCSGVQEEAKVDKVETDDPIDSSTRGIYTSSSSDELKDSKIEQGDDCIVEVGDELKDSKIEQGDNCIVEVGDDTLKSSSPLVKTEVGTSSSGNDCSESHSMPLGVSLCSDDSFGKPGVPQVDELITVPDTVRLSLSQLKDEENVGVSESKSVELSESQNDTEGSNADQRNCSDRLQSGHLVTVSHTSEDALSMKGTKLEVEISDKINATPISELEGDPERLTSKNIDALPFCSLVKEDNDVLIQDEQKDPLILEGSCTDGTKVQDSIVSPLPQEKSECSEAEMVHQIKASDCDMVDPGLTSKSKELTSLSVMEEDKVDASPERDVLCNPLAATENEENQMDDNEESKPLEVETGHQIEASTDISESSAAEIANVSQAPNSSASVEKEEGLSEKGVDESTAKMQADVGDGMDISSVCSSAAVSELVELSEKDSIGNSETDVTKEKDDVAQEENAPRD